MDAFILSLPDYADLLGVAFTAPINKADLFRTQKPPPSITYRHDWFRCWSTVKPAPPNRARRHLSFAHYGGVADVLATDRHPWRDCA